jgi:hypothetical protein
MSRIRNTEPSTLITVKLFIDLNSLYPPHIAKTQYRKFETNIPRKGIVRPQSQFLDSCVCERFIYSHDRSVYSAVGKYVDRSLEYINRSQTHECGTGLGAISFQMGIHKWIFVAV